MVFPYSITLTAAVAGHEFWAGGYTTQAADTVLSFSQVTTDNVGGSKYVNRQN